MAPPRTKTKAEALVTRFRETIRRERITRADAFNLINARYLREQPMKQATYDKLVYGPPGKNVSADTAIALTKFIEDFNR